MGFFDRYPYTNWHNVNLDWILERVKEWGEMVVANDQAFKDLQEANEAFKEYVTEYLQNLDIQAQIDDKLDRMFEDGSLNSYLQPYCTITVTNWLDENITVPEGVIIDASLTVEGAAADSKATGDGINQATLKVEREIFVGTPLSEDTTIYKACTDQLETGYSIDGVTVGTRITFHKLATAVYNTYYFYSSSAGYIYFDSVPAVEYLGVGKIDNAGPVTPDNSNPPIISVSGVNPVRYRSIDNDLPDINNKMPVRAGTFVCFTVRGEVNPDTIHFILEVTEGGADKTLLNNNVKLNNTQIDQLEGGFIEYHNESGPDGATEYFNIYLKTVRSYICYVLAHSVYAVRNCDMWRISYAYSVNDNFTISTPLTITGEWEAAIKLQGRSDFTGGLLHGDEITEGINIFIDGRLTDKTLLSTRKPFKHLSIVQTSNMYDKNDHTTIFAEHGSVHEFKRGRMIIKQSVKFLDSYIIDRSYLSMFPISKTYSSYFFSNEDFDYVQMYNPVRKTKATQVYLIGSNVESIFTDEKHEGMTSYRGLFITDNSGNSYNKCYYVAAENNTEVSSATVWTNETSFEIIN